MSDLPSWPSAHGAPVIRARFKVEPEDFLVREWLGFEPDGDGDHMLVIVRKRGANTQWVARQLARFARCDVRDVGFAGLKDRQAVTEQAYTVPSRQIDAAQWLDCHGDGFNVIAATRTRRKLKRGAHKGNDFEVILREVTLCDVKGDVNALRERLELIGARGVPNYFGYQRFGNDGANLTRARQWFIEGVEPAERIDRSFALSAARSFLFNEVLAERIRQGTWNRLQSGDRANLNGSNSVFSVTEMDQTLQRRLDEFDIHPTGPLWGRGELSTAQQVAELEQQMINNHMALAQGLERAGLEQERRALRLWVQQFQWDLDQDTLTLKFRLMRGGFATAVLAALMGDELNAFQENDEGN